MYIFNKKAFQSNANRPLADSPGDVLNKFEHIQRVGCYTVRSMLNKFDHFWRGQGQWDGEGEGVIWNLPVNRQKRMKTLSFRNFVGWR